KLKRFEINPGDKVTEIIVADVDGDGLEDLIILMGREVRVHFQRAPGSFQAEPDQRFKIDPRAVIMDVGAVLGTKEKTIAFLREDGVYAYPLRPPESGKDKPYFELRAKRI